LRIEAADGGEPRQSSQTVVLVDIEAGEAEVIPKNENAFKSKPAQGAIQFSLRNYT
jgi:hypothetical protein